MEKERFTTKFAETLEENRKAYSLRYTDMLKEYRPELEIASGLDCTEYDKYAKQVICVDNENGQVVGCYRIITSEWLGEKPFVCEEEFDITSLKNTGEKIAELSRAVVKREYRNTTVLMHLFRFIISYLREQGYRFIIGEASFFGTDKNVFAKEFSYLANLHSTKQFDIKAKEDYQVQLIPTEQLNQPEIKRSLPSLIRAYLSFGAKVSKDTFTDKDFGSVDVFILLDTLNYNQAYINRLLRI